MTKEYCKDCINFTRANLENCKALEGGIKTVNEMKGWRTQTGECIVKKVIDKNVKKKKK